MVGHKGGISVRGTIANANQSCMYIVQKPEVAIMDVNTSMPVIHHHQAIRPRESGSRPEDNLTHPAAASYFTTQHTIPVKPTRVKNQLWTFRLQEGHLSEVTGDSPHPVAASLTWMRWGRHSPGCVPCGRESAARPGSARSAASSVDRRWRRCDGQIMVQQRPAPILLHIG